MMYEKLACWGETGNKEKNAAVEAAQTRIKELEAEIPIENIPSVYGGRAHFEFEPLHEPENLPT